MRPELRDLPGRKVAFEGGYRPEDAVDDDRFVGGGIGAIHAEGAACGGDDVGIIVRQLQGAGISGPIVALRPRLFHPSTDWICRVQTAIAECAFVKKVGASRVAALSAY